LLDLETERKRVEERMELIRTGKLDADYRANKIKVGEDGRATPNFMTDKKGNPLSEEQIVQKLEKVKNRTLFILEEHLKSNNLKDYVQIENNKIIESAKNLPKINLGELAKDEKGFAEAKQLLMRLLSEFNSEEIVKLNQKIAKELALSGKKVALAGFALGSLSYLVAKLTLLKPKNESIHSS